MGYYYPGGLSNKSGAYSLMRGKVYTSRPVLYVHSADGDDANDGTSYLRPKATLQSAVNAATAEHTVIVLKSGSSETIATQVNLTGKPVTIVGESLVGASPDAELILGISGSISIIGLAQDGTEIANVSFPARTMSSGVNSNLVLSGDHDVVRDCLFLCGENESGLLDISSDHALVSGCRFESSEASANASQVTPLEGSGLVSDVCENCTFDAGPFGTLSPVGLMSRVLNATVLRGVRVDAEFLRYGTIGKSTLGGGFEDVPDGGLLLSDGISDFGSDQLVSGDPTYISTDGVLYVDSATGDDANDGSACEPLATLAVAISTANAATTSPVIVLRSTHNEVVTSVIVADTSLTIVGEKGAKISAGTSGMTVLTLDAPSAEVRGVMFGVEDGLTNCILLELRDSGQRVSGCDFELLVGCTGVQGVSSPGATISDCKFHGAGARRGILVFGSSDHITLRDCEFDAEGVEYIEPVVDMVVAIDGLRMSGITLKNCANVSVAAASTGYIQISESDDTCHVEAF